MAKNISIKVMFGNAGPLKSMAEVKKYIKKARLTLLNEVKSDFNEWNLAHAEIKESDAETEEALYLYGTVDFKGEAMLSKEIAEMCDALEAKLTEYDALMKFEIAKAPETADTNA